MKDQRWYDDNRKTQYGDASIRDPWAEAARAYHQENINKAVDAATRPLLLRIAQLERENADLRQALDHARDVRITGLKDRMAELEEEIKALKQPQRSSFEESIANGWVYG